MSQTERIFFIDRRIREQGGVSSAEIARRFEVSTRQAKRDVEYLRDRLDAPIEYDVREKRYRYSAEYRALEFADEKTFLFYIFTRAVARNLNYIPVVSDELIDGIAKQISSNYQKIADRLAYETWEYERLPDEIIYAVMRSMLDKRRLRVDYTDVGGKSTTRDIEALKLINNSGRWYCAAWDHLSSELRVFLLARMVAAVPLEAGWTNRVGDAELDAYVENAYGIYKGARTETAVLRFYEPAFGIVKSQVWHPRQALSLGTHADRGDFVELSLPVARYPEILGRVLRYGAAGEVLAPEALRRLWVEEIRKMGRLVGDLQPK